MTTKNEGLTTRVISCPTCRKSTRYDPQNEFRPFCSARCKNEDIVGWAEESFRIPGRTVGIAEVEGGKDGPEDEED